MVEAILVIVLIAASAAIGLSSFRRQPTAQRQATELTNAVAAQIRAARLVALREGDLGLPPLGNFHSVVVSVRPRVGDPSVTDLVTERLAVNGAVQQRQVVALPDGIRLVRNPDSIRFDEFGRLVRADKNPSGPVNWQISAAGPANLQHTIQVQAQTSAVRVQHPPQS